MIGFRTSHILRFMIFLLSAARSFFPQPHAEFVLWEDGHNQGQYVWDHFVNPFLLLMTQLRPERSSNLPKVTQHTVPEVGAWPTLPESSLSSFSWRQGHLPGPPTLQGAVSFASVPAVQVCQTGRTLAGARPPGALPPFPEDLLSFASTSTFKIPKVFDASNSWHPHPTSILGLMPIIQSSELYCSGLRVASKRKHNLNWFNLGRGFIGLCYWKVQGVNWLLTQEKLDLAM